MQHLRDSVGLMAIPVFFNYNQLLTKSPPKAQRARWSRTHRAERGVLKDGNYFLEHFSASQSHTDTHSTQSITSSEGAFCILLASFVLYPKASTSIALMVEIHVHSSTQLISRTLRFSLHNPYGRHPSVRDLSINTVNIEEA